MSPALPRIVIVPLPKSVARGTLSSILRQAGLTPTRLIALLDRPRP